MKGESSKVGLPRKRAWKWRRRNAGGTDQPSEASGAGTDPESGQDPGHAPTDPTFSDADNLEDGEFALALIRRIEHDPTLPLLRASPSFHGELIRKLRTELLLRHGYNNIDPLAFAVVSTSTGDGRSMLAAELALSFAQLGRPTLLIEADLRSPRQDRLFGTEVMEGLAQTLATGEPPKLGGVEGVPTLSVLGAGEDSGYNPTELVSSMRFKRTIDAMRNLFDFIVVDTPPFNDYADAQIISAVIGRVLTLHRSKVSSFSDTRTMLNSLARSRTEIFGGVLNQF